MKKILSFILTLIMLLSNVPTVFAASTEEEALGKVNLYSKCTGTQLLTWKGIIDAANFAPDMIVYKASDGSEMPAYCIDPSTPGVENVPGKNYDVNADTPISYAKAWGCLANGYPYKSASELGLNSDYEAYYATKMALWCIMHENYSDINDWKANGANNQKVMDAMKTIYNAGMSTTSIPQSAGSITATPSTQIAEIDNKDSNFLSQTFSVSSASNYSVSLDSSTPSGTKVADEQNNPKTTFNQGEKFKVLIPKSGTTTSGNFNINITGEGAAKVILYGSSYSDSTQDYAVTTQNTIGADTQATVTYIVETGDDPDKPTPGTLKIVKIDAGTTKGLAGAVFRVTDVDGGVVGDYITDGNGQVTVALQDLGAYYVDEIEPPYGYQLDENSHKDIVVTLEEDAILTFANKPTTDLIITKVDDDTGEKLAKATIRVAYDGGHKFVDVITDNTGTAKVNNLPDGTYTVTEIAAPSGYILDNTPHSIKLESGKPATITLTNKAKPGILIKKFDESTGMPLAKAEFSIKKKDGSIVYEGITGLDGTIKVENLEADWYTVTEIAPPPGYLINTESKDVKLEPNKVVEVKFDNRKRPSLQIMKVDSETNKPLEGAKFYVKKAEGGTESEYITDASGTITINDLDEAVYTVWEFESPSGYLLDEQHKDIKLEWGKTKTLVFTNKAKPALEILKIDEETKQPLEGAKFKVTQTENKTTSEYVTDKDGRILITELENKIYSVEEIVPPEGYLLDEQHKDIKLEWGKTKTLIFTNKAKPKLRILKIDVVTGKPLANAEFRVSKVEDKTVNEYITDAKGEILIEDLDEAIYRVEEFMPPDGYILYTSTKEIMTEWGKTKTLKFDNIRKPTLVFLKTNGLTGKPIAGATFKVEYETKDGGLKTLGSFKTGADGRIIIPKVNVGWYVFTETRAANGYSLPKNPITRVYVEAGQNAYLPYTEQYYSVPSALPDTGSTNTTETTEEITDIAPSIKDETDIIPTVPSNGTSSIETHYGSEYYVEGEGFNWPLNSIVIKKTNAITGELLAGASFELYRADEQVSGVPGTNIGTYTTDKSGIVVITGLESGYYVVKESKAPQHFLISENNLQNGFLKADGTTVLEFSFANYPYGSILITKVDGVTGEPLSNAKFKVTDNSGAVLGNTTGEYTTDSKGEILISNVKPGNYVVTEIQAPANYAINDTPKTVEVGTDGKTYKVSFDNYPYGSILITKVDGVTGEPLSNAKFKVTDNSGTVLGNTTGEHTTDSKGEILISNVKPGNYVVTEIQAPTNYAINNTPKTIKVGTDGKTYKVSFDNYPYGSILIAKVDGITGEPLSNAKFKVTDNSGTALGNTTGEYTTDSKGEILIPNVKPGNYVVTEIQAPTNYAINNTPKTIKVGTDGKTYKVSFDNYPYGSLVIKKLDGVTKEPLANAEFKITTSKGDVVGTGNGIYTTNSTGLITIPNLPNGSYIIKETSAPKGYILENQSKTIEIEYGKTYTLEFFNNKKSSLQIIKIDSETKQPLKHAQFTVYKKSGEVIGNYETDANGVIIIDNLDVGWLKIVETKAPLGYLLDETPKDVEITNNQFVKVTFENNPMSSVIIKKFDVSNKTPLAGARFKVTKKSGDVIGEFVTDSNGIIQIDDIPTGWYTAVEVAAPAGYKIADVGKDFQVVHTKTVTLEFPNEKLTSLIIKKVDDKSGEPLAGALFKVEKQNGQVIGEYTTDKDGLINITTLEPDWYVISEMRSPDGYLLDSKPKTVEVKTNSPTNITFTNKKLTSLIIKKVDDKSGEPLSGALFKVEKQNGQVIGEYTTDKDGLINITTLEPDWYVISEMRSPDGYLLDSKPKTVEVKTNSPTNITFTNKKLTSLIIKKVDDKSGEPLAGALFKVEKQNGQVIGEYTTDKDGLINITTLEPDWYVISEMRSPDGYLLDNKPKTVEVKTDSPTNIIFTNKKLTSLVIKKVDDKSGEPLSGALFKVEKQNGEIIGEYTTDKNGLINITTLEPDWYVISEMRSPDGYLLDSKPKTVEVKTESPTNITFTNKKLTGIQIKKIDEKTGAALSGAEFTITKQNGEKIGDTYITDASGFVNIPNLQPDYYIITEVKAPENYLLDNTPKVVQVKTDTPALVTFTNRYMSGIQIIKVDAATGTPLPGAKFTVYKKSGDILGNYTTDKNGVIIIDSLENGWYKIAETKSPDGYLIDEIPKDVEIKGNQFLKIVFENRKMTGLQIKKIDELTGAALPGAVFTIEKQNGEKIFTNENGTEFITDAQGFINIPNLNPDYYIVREIKAPSGYILDNTPKTVQVKTDTPTVVTFSNKPLAGLKIVKLNSVTKEPIEGVEFSITKANGEKVQNDNRGYTFTTDKTGQIYISELEDGIYSVTETKAADGYFIDGEPKEVEIKSGKATILEVLNQPASGLLIVKTDANTGKPLAGVQFDIKKANGQRVQGSILDQNQPNTENNSPNKTTTSNGDILGSYTTDANGRILINTLAPGEYHVVETKALDGYVLDTDVHSVTVTAGKQATLKLQNTPMAGLRILKIDSISKKPIFGVEFMVFDENKNVVGTYYSDNNGVVDLSSILVEGRYTIRETKAAQGYYLDEIPKTIEFKAGKVTEIIWTNVPQMGQIQLFKKSADDNEVNGLPAGTPLEGAIFEAYEYKSGNMVDRFISGSDGKAVSKPLPVGRYIIKEVKAPQNYRISDKQLDIEIEFATQIIKQEFVNYSVNTGVHIKKTGNVEAMPGDTIRYDIKAVQNTSTSTFDRLFLA